MDFSCKINVVIQLSRAPQESGTEAPPGNWCGVRRYMIEDHEARLIDDLGIAGMAEPSALLDFLLWGSRTYPAAHFMLIISGHGCGFIGVLGDSNEKQLCLMSIRSFAETLAEFYRLENHEISILLFDACYMNMVEVLYEMALILGHAVKYVLLPQGNPPTEGLPWPLIIKKLSGTSSEAIEEKVIHLVQSVNRIYSEDSAIFAVRLDIPNFTMLKMATDKAAALIMEDNGIRRRIVDSCRSGRKNVLMNLAYLFKQLKNREIEMQAQDALSRIITYPNTDEMANRYDLGLCIYMPEHPGRYALFYRFYAPLLFCRDNRWINILTETPRAHL
jgi:hypothetical protein